MSLRCLAPTSTISKATQTSGLKLLRRAWKISMARTRSRPLTGSFAKTSPSSSARTKSRSGIRSVAEWKTCMLNELVSSSKINSLIPAHKCWGTWPLFFISKFKSETVREVTCLHHRAKIWSKLLLDPRENVKSPCNTVYSLMIRQSEHYVVGTFFCYLLTDFESSGSDKDLL